VWNIVVKLFNEVLQRRRCFNTIRNRDSDTMSLWDLGSWVDILVRVLKNEDRSKIDEIKKVEGGEDEWCWWQNLDSWFINFGLFSVKLVQKGELIRVNFEQNRCPICGNSLNRACN
jgi:hypothetical protein